MEQILYSCRALDSSGIEVQVSVTASTKEEVVEKLRELGLFPKKIEILDDQRFEIAEKKKKSAKKGFQLGGLFKTKKKVPAKTIMVFIRQLATLLDAGLPLLRSLTMLQSQQPAGPFKEVLGELRASIQSGEPLSDAMSHHPTVFNRLFIKMVKAGELGGVLDTVLNRLAEFTEKAHKLKSKVKSALMYPVIILSIAVLIVTGLLIFIVPKFQKIFADMLGGKPLPFITQMVVDFSDFLQNDFIWILVAIGAGYPLITKLLQIPKISRLIDKGLYWMPMFGELNRMSAISQFSRTLGTLSASGVPLLQALINAKETATSGVIADAVNVIHGYVKQGETIRHAMDAAKVFPMMVVGMIEVGEETGALSKMLLKIADLYDEEVDTIVSGLTALIEPIMIVLLALLVGTIVIALFLPLVSIMSGVSDAH